MRFLHGGWEQKKAMKLEIKEANGIVSFIFQGRLDAVTSEGVESDIMQSITEGGRYLYNLASLHYISSAGLRVLLATSKEIQHKQGRFVMCASNPDVRHILEISGFASIFHLVDTLEEGQEALAG
jgi:anti-sigma B factor antagonist